LSFTILIFIYLFAFPYNMLQDLGKVVSEEEASNLRMAIRNNDVKGILCGISNGGKNGVYKYIHRLIKPHEFYNKKGPASLLWEELSQVKRLDDDNCLTLMSFNNLLSGLLSDLEKKGLMSFSTPREGDYYLIDVKHGGIEVKRQDGFSDSYYPRVKEDAEEYIKHFWSGTLYPVYVAQLISSPNKAWLTPKGI